jgi:hypothetical protein
VTGEGPLDLVFVPGFVTHMELQRKTAGFGEFFEAERELSRQAELAYWRLVSDWRSSCTSVVALACGR